MTTPNAYGFTLHDHSLTWTGDGEYLRVDPWGANSLRVRARLMTPPEDTTWALLDQPFDDSAFSCTIDDGTAALRYGDITAVLHADADADANGCRLHFLNQHGDTLLQEAGDGGALRWRARAHHPTEYGTASPSVTFVSPHHEHLYGMGEYQQPIMDLKGSTLELAHRNSQVSVPFVVSSAGYGFLWHNPAVGEVSFGRNRTTWTAGASDQIDYWITAADTPARILAQYANATGHAPMMPDWGMGFWQCKLRYWNQEQLLETARRFHREGIPLDLIVIDFFHWPLMGDFRFDEEFWPNPKAMCDELHNMGVKVMVSVCPQIDLESENHGTMKRRNFLAKTRQGKDVGMWWPRDSQFFDATNPEAREFVWDLCRRNYADLGIDAFWLDEAEPEWGGDYDYAHYLFHAGPVHKVGNIYPQLYAKTFYDGQQRMGRQGQTVSLARAAWAGSQRYGALVWSGDVHSTFDDLKAQITCAIHMGMAGIPWFTTDMGGFMGGDITTDAFKELYMRWCQFSCFSPVMRNHGDRGPSSHPVLDQRGNAITHVHTGDDNEPWSFGPEVERVVRHYIDVREAMRPHTRELFEQAHESGQPIVRGLFYEFPNDETTSDIADEYLFGPDILVAPVTEAGATARRVYLPEGATWTDVRTGNAIEGGTWVQADAPIDVVPLYARDGRDHGLADIL